MSAQSERALTFKALHAQPRGFLMLNAWDPGSAVILKDAGAKVIGTTSAGIAFSMAKPDFDCPDPSFLVTRDEMFERIRQIAAATSLPVNADLEHGYGSDPRIVAETIKFAITAGLAGGNIEDHDPGDASALYEESLSIERIRAARATIDAHGALVLNAKIDALTITPETGLATSIRRANLFLEAGADCVYPCGAGDLETVKTLVREIAGPVNIALGWGTMKASVSDLLGAGVQRVSVGGSIARAALGLVRRAARELLDRGVNDFAAGQIPQPELNAIFTGEQARRQKPHAARRTL